MTNNTTKGVKKSAFTGSTTIPSGSYIDFVVNGQNLRILDTDFYAALGVVGSIIQEGDPLGTPVLDKQGSVNAIRNITAGFGISSSINAQNGITFATDFSFDETGAALVEDVSSPSPTFKSLVAGTGVTLAAASGTITISADVVDSIVIVKAGSQLTGTIDSTKLYFLDGIIDMTGLGTITVPAGGISLAGEDFNISGLISSTVNHVMLTGTGSVKMRNISLSVTGAGASVYSLVGATGSEAIETTSVNYNNCTSLGEIDDYRQGLELDTGRFGGSPSLTLSGSWDGYRVSTAIVRSLDNSISEPLFKEGTSLTFSGRFITDINADLGTLAALTDFTNSNFLNASAFIIDTALIRRNGVSDASDATINTGINEADLASSWSNNSGIPNTFEGGRLEITSETATALSGVSIGDFLDLAGTYATSDLQHFDSPSSGQLRHLGDDPREYSIFVDLTIDGTSGDEITIKVVKWDDSASGFVDIAEQTREVFNFTGSNDAGFFLLKNVATLDQNDYLKLQIANTTAARDATAKVADYFIVEAR